MRLGYAFRQVSCVVGPLYLGTVEAAGVSVHLLIICEISLANLEKAGRFLNAFTF